MSETEHIEDRVDRCHAVFEALRRVRGCGWRDAAVIAYGPDVYASMLIKNRTLEIERLEGWHWLDEGRA
jgi:hypothetical protein